MDTKLTRVVFRADPLSNRAAAMKYARLLAAERGVSSRVVKYGAEVCRYQGVDAYFPVIVYRE